MALCSRQTLFLSALCALSCAVAVPVQVEKSPVVPVPSLMSSPSTTPVLPSAEPVTLQTEVELETGRYFTHGALKQAKDAFDRGSFKQARKLLEDQGDSNEVRFLRAMCAFRGGDFKKSGPELLALAKRYTPMKDRCSMYAGVSFEKLQDFSSAVEAYAGVPAKTVFFNTARFSLSRVRQRLGDLDAAKEALKPLTVAGNQKRAEALAEIARLEESAGHAEEAKALWAEIWSSHPTSPQSVAASARLATKDLTVELLLRRAEALLEQRRSSEAVLTAREVGRKAAQGSAQKCRAKFVEAQAQARLRALTLARSMFAGLVAGSCADADARAQSLALLAAGMEPKEAVVTYDRLVREHPAHALADDALFAGAMLSMRSGDLEGAVQRFERVAAEYSDGDHAADALFRAFWLYRRNGNFSGALSALDRLDVLKSTAAQTEKHHQVDYWKARLWEESGDRVLAATLLESIVRSAPGTYYGLLAKSRLLALDPARPDFNVPVLDASLEDSDRHLALRSLWQDVHFRSGLELLRLDFPGALGELLAVDLSQKPIHAKPLYLKVLLDAGRKKEVQLLSSQGELSGTFDAETAPIWRAAFPKSFRALVERSAADASVDPDLLQAVIREESRFDPMVRSGAGAVGLVQILPSTAAIVARQAGLQHFDAATLWQPHQNVKLGSLYLKSLLKTFKGNWLHAVASYNAGPGAVEKWMKSQPELQSDEFVEEIPYKETREYVKKVLGSYAAYSLISSAGATRLAQVDGLTPDQARN